MIILDNDIRELVNTSRTDLTYLSFDFLRSTDTLPALRIRQDSTINNQTLQTFNVTFQMFLQYPADCRTFNEAIASASLEAETGFKIIEELIFVGLVLHKGYKLTIPLSEVVFNGQSVTEHKVIGLQTTVTLEKKSKYECCEEGLYFDFTSYQNQNTWSQ